MARQVQRQQQQGPAEDGHAGHGAQQLPRECAPPRAKAGRRLRAALRCNARPPPRWHLVLPDSSIRGPTRPHSGPWGASLSWQRPC